LDAVIKEGGKSHPAAGPFFVAMSTVRASQIENWNQRSRAENDLVDKKVKFGKVKKKKTTLKTMDLCEQRSSYAHSSPPLHDRTSAYTWRWEVRTEI
jgi:hypothetical protein